MLSLLQQYKTQVGIPTWISCVTRHQWYTYTVLHAYVLHHSHIQSCNIFRKCMHRFVFLKQWNTHIVITQISIFSLNFCGKTTSHISIESRDACVSVPQSNLQCSTYLNLLLPVDLIDKKNSISSSSAFFNLLQDVLSINTVCY